MGNPDRVRVTGPLCAFNSGFAAELVRAAPFEAPFHNLAAIVSDVHLNPGMRIHELELFDGPGNLLGLVAESSTGMMCQNRLNRQRR